MVSYLSFGPKDVGGMLLRNVGLSTNCMVLQHSYRRQDLRSNEQETRIPVPGGTRTPAIQHFTKFPLLIHS
jgi:hypothetical protein